MKTNFKTEEDRELLEQIFFRALMSTENIFEPELSSIHDLRKYRDQVIETRKKIFECLEQDDPNVGQIAFIQKQAPAGEITHVPTSN